MTNVWRTKNRQIENIFTQIKNKTSHAPMCNDEKTFLIKNNFNLLFLISYVHYGMCLRRHEIKTRKPTIQLGTVLSAFVRVRPFSHQLHNLIIVPFFQPRRVFLTVLCTGTSRQA